MRQQIVGRVEVEIVYAFVSMEVISIEKTDAGKLLNAGNHVKMMKYVWLTQTVMKYVYAEILEPTVINVRNPVLEANVVI